MYSASPENVGPQSPYPRPKFPLFFLHDVCPPRFTTLPVLHSLAGFLRKAVSCNHAISLWVGLRCEKAGSWCHLKNAPGYLRYPHRPRKFQAGLTGDLQPSQTEAGSRGYLKRQGAPMFMQKKSNRADCLSCSTPYRSWIFPLTSVKFRKDVKDFKCIKPLQKYMKTNSSKEEKDLNWGQDKNVTMRYSAH